MIEVELFGIIIGLIGAAITGAFVVVLVDFIVSCCRNKKQKEEKEVHDAEKEGTVPENKFIDEAVKNSIIRGLNSVTCKYQQMDKHLTSDEYLAFERAKEIIKDYAFSGAELQQYKAWRDAKNKTVCKKQCPNCAGVWKEESIDVTEKLTVQVVFYPKARKLVVEAQALRYRLFDRQEYPINYCPWCGRKLK